MPIAAQAPRVDTHPHYTRSHGPDAVALAARAGLFLDPWQQESLRTMLAVDDDGKFVCFEHCEIVSRQNGKGSILEARILAGMFLLEEELIMVSAHEFKTAIELFLRVKQLIRVLIEEGELLESDIKVIHANGEQGFELISFDGNRLKKERRVKFIARSKDSGRGFSGDLNIIDEAYAYTNQQQSALMPTMSARQNPQIIYTSSPPISGEAGEILFSLRYRGDPSIPRRKGDPPWSQDAGLAYRDWGLAGDLDHLDEIDLSDRRNWAATNPAAGTRIAWTFIEREYRAMTSKNPADFARERLGIWPSELTDETTGLIPDELWASLAVDAYRPPDVAMAVVVNYARTYTAIAAVGERPDGRLQVSIVDYRAGTHWVVGRVMQLRERWSPVGWAVQDKGPSATLIAPLIEAGLELPADRDEPRRGQLAVPWAADVAVAYGLTMDALTEGRLTHLDEPRLNQAASLAALRPLGGGNTWDYRVEGSELLQAMTLAHWLYVTWAPKLTSDRDEIGIW